ncbi:MAG: hypothetical protein IT535_14205 [Bauldia sp.]|nr:hypothetical protein [Bauldia sp.]
MTGEHDRDRKGSPPAGGFPSDISSQNGFLREAALKRLAGALSESASFVRVAARLNDWVPAVRRAAEDAAQRTFPLTNAGVVADSLIALSPGIGEWRRWGARPPDVLIAAFGRPEVMEKVADFLCTVRRAGATRVIRFALMFPAIDRHLARLAVEALSPAVRGIAVHALTEGMALWPSGLQKRWIDKSLGQYRWVPGLAKRPLTCNVDIEGLLARTVVDRVASVRRTAADGMVKHRATLGNLDQLLAIVREDRRWNVRFRADWVDRERAKAAG